MKFNLFNKIVDIDDKYINLYENFMHEKFTEDTFKYMAASYECDENMSAEEIGLAVQNNIAEHVLIYEDAAEQIAILKKNLCD